MKKSLLALAIAGAFAASAQAKSNIAIYGSFDAGIRHQTNYDTGGNSRISMSSIGTFSSNHLGFRGIEDLGEGLNAHLTLESGFNSGTGGLDAADTVFNRTAAVGLGGSWGSLDLGRQYTVAFKTINAYDPFNYRYPGIADAVRSSFGMRKNNVVQYNGTFDALTVRAEYVLGEVGDNTRRGSAESVGGNYDAGAFSVGGAIAQSEDAAGLNTNFFTHGGAAKFGPTRVSAGYVKQEAEIGPIDLKTRWNWIGASYAVSPAAELTGAFYKTKVSGFASGDKDNFILGAIYALSKRTNLYAGFDSAKYDGDARIPAAGLGNTSGPSRQRGISIGLNHLF